MATGSASSSSRPARKRAAAKPATAAPAAEAEAAGEPDSGAKALIRAGLKALGDVRGDMLARQAKVFELLLGIGQSPVWKLKAQPLEPLDPFGKFEAVFDQRVARSLQRLGVPAPEQIAALTEQVQLLTAQVQQLQRQLRSQPPATTAPPPRPRRR